MQTDTTRFRNNPCWSGMKEGSAWNPHEVLRLWSTGEPFLLAAVHHQESGRRARHSAESEDSPEGTPSYHGASEDSSPSPTLPNLVHSRVGHLLDPLARNTQERGCGECGFCCISFCDCCNKSHKLNGLKCSFITFTVHRVRRLKWNSLGWHPGVGRNILPLEALRRNLLPCLIGFQVLPEFLVQAPARS